MLRYISFLFYSIHLCLQICCITSQTCFNNVTRICMRVWPEMCSLLKLFWYLVRVCTCHTGFLYMSGGFWSEFSAQRRHLWGNRYGTPYRFWKACSILVRGLWRPESGSARPDFHVIKRICVCSPVCNSHSPLCSNLFTNHTGHSVFQHFFAGRGESAACGVHSRMVG